MDLRELLLLGERAALGEGVLDEAADEVHPAAVLLDPSDLGRGGDAGHEEVGSDAGSSGCPGDARRVVAAGCGADSARGPVEGEDGVERTARLERAAVLHQLQLEDHPPVDVRQLLERDDGCTANGGTDALPGGLEVLEAWTRRHERAACQIRIPTKASAPAIARSTTISTECAT